MVVAVDAVVRVDDIGSSTRAICSAMAFRASEIAGIKTDDDAAHFIRRHALVYPLRSWSSSALSESDAMACAIALCLWLARGCPKLFFIGLPRESAQRLADVTRTINENGRLVGAQWARGSGWRAWDTVALILLRRLQCYGVTDVMIEISSSETHHRIRSALRLTGSNRLSSGSVDAVTGLPAIEESGIFRTRLAPWRNVVLAREGVIVDGDTSKVLSTVLHERLTSDAAPPVDGLIARLGPYEMSSSPAMVDPLLAAHHDWMVRARCGRLSSPELGHRFQLRESKACPLCLAPVGSAQHGVISCSWATADRKTARQRLEAIRRDVIVLGRRVSPPQWLQEAWRDRSGSWLPWLPTLSDIVAPRCVVILDVDGSWRRGGDGMVLPLRRKMENWCVVVALPMSRGQMVQLSRLSRHDWVVLPWHACSAAKPRPVSVVVAAGCWPAWPASATENPPSVIPRGEARLHVSLEACEGGAWATCAMCLCSPLSSVEAVEMASRLASGGVRGRAAAIVVPDTARMCRGMSESLGSEIVADDNEMWAASCGVARSTTLDRWLPGLSGRDREFATRLLLRACVVEARWTWARYTKECRARGTPCGHRLLADEVEAGGAGDQ